MKNHNQLAAYAIMAILLTACSATNRLTMGATQPAPVHIASDVHRIGIINRSLPSEGNKPLDELDKIISIEGRNLDKDGANAAITALYDELEQNQQFDKVVLLETIPGISKGLGVLPATLSWDTVDTLCKENGVDVIFSLEFYDTDTQASYKATTMSIPNNLGVKVAVPAHEVTLNTQIKNGWRIYDPQTRQVVDERLYNDRVISSGKGINPVKAIKAIINRKEAVVQQSKNIGVVYGQRLLPFKTRIGRDYFVRGSENFVVAKRKAQTGDWQGAAQLWEREVNNPNPKIAGRACYNMAISNEINGDLKAAMDWASKAYTDYRNKDALRYLNILKYRNTQNHELERQLSGNP